jgi:hypothetical protein
MTWFNAFIVWMIVGTILLISNGAKDCKNENNPNTQSLYHSLFWTVIIGDLFFIMWIYFAFFIGFLFYSIRKAN